MGKGRTLVMGDIHGHYRAYKQVMERANFDYEKDRLIHIGDIVDRWPEPHLVVEDMMKIKELVAIRGNHDTWVYNFLEFGMAPHIWLSQGGQKTLDAYRDYENWEAHRKFFKYQDLYFIDEKNRAYVHAGWQDDLKHDGEKVLTWERDFWYNALAADRTGNDLKLTREYEEVFIGHTTTINWKSTVPMKATNIWNMDTGAGYNGKLSLMDVDSKELFQSDLVEFMYDDGDIIIETVDANDE